MLAPVGIFIYTYCNLAKYKASFKRWILFCGICVVFVFLASIGVDLIISESHVVLKHLVNYLVGVGFCDVLIEIQLDDKPAESAKTYFSKNAKKILISVAIIAITVAFCFTALPTIIDALSNASAMKIEDINGESNYSLNTITREELINGTDNS